MPTEELTEEQVEQLVTNIDETGLANPPGKEEGATEPASLSFDNSDALMAHELEYTANGKTVKENLSTILKRASQGYNYAQLSHEQKERGKVLDEQSRVSTESEAKWGKFEKFAKENPKWLDHWNNAYENRDQALPTEAATTEQTGGFDDTRMLALLEQKLEPMRDHIEKQNAAKAQDELRSQDQALDQETKETRAEFPNIDFDDSDPETGKTLQFQVLEFAGERGMGFKDAFKVFYHDKLISTRMEDEKAKWTKEQSQNAKDGILGVKPTSTKSSNGPDFSNSSWDQVAEYAGKQLGFA
jgi:hypothetical protein